jgi:hypothetical protein
VRVRLHILLVVALSLALLAPGAAAAKGPAKVHPKLQVTAAKVTGGSLRFTVTVTFAPPAGASAAAACKGKLKLSEKVKHGKAPHWSGTLKAKAGLCAAAIKGRLPAKLFNHKVAFRIAFAGNGKVAAFARAPKLKLAPPHIRSGGVGGEGGGTGSEPSSPAVEPEGPSIPGAPWLISDGGWYGHENEETPYFFSLEFTVKGGVIQAPFGSPNQITLKCLRYDGLEQTKYLVSGFYFEHEMPLHAGGSFADTYSFSGESAGSQYHQQMAVHGQLGATEGTITVEITDAGYTFEGHTEDQCSGAITLEAWNKYPAA